MTSTHMGKPGVRIAYLVSRYPAVSHTFILREVVALRERGVEVATFSVRRAEAQDCLDEQARREARTTRSLIPVPWGAWVRALLWAVVSRPLRTCRTLAAAVRLGGPGLRGRLKWLAYFGEAVLLARWLAAGRFDRLHCHFGNSGSSTGLLAARLAGVRYSLTCHGSELREPVKYRLADKVAQADFVACVSEYGRSLLKGICPVDHWSKLHLVRCGLPRSNAQVQRAAGFNPRGGGAAASHREEVNETPRLHILCVARLSAEKGHLVLLDALAELRRRGVAFRCTLVGDGPERSAIETRIGALDLGEAVVLKGALPPERVAELYPSADGVVLASFSEGVPVVLMEALACGRPVVATWVGGVPELVEHGVCGLLVEPGDAKELAEALAEVLRDGALAARLGANGRAAVEREFCMNKSVSQLQGLLCGGDHAPWRLSTGETPVPHRGGRGRRLLIVSPVRDEAAYLQRTIDSMVAQTVRPTVWAIVDDGSADDTPLIARRAAEQHPWIHFHTRADRGVRRVGGGVVEAFNDGLARYNLDDFDYVCKFDGDLAFGPTYFERLFDKFDADPRLGTASGKAWIEVGGRLVPERSGDEFSQGQSKLYRVECFKQIGGFVREVMWDGIDCHRCRMLGWQARSFRDEELRFLHLRPMGSSFHSIYRGRLRWGYGQYFMGTHPLYALGIAGYRMLERPWIAGGLLLLAGYLGGYLRRRPRYEDPQFRAHLQHWQLARLGLRRRATGHSTAVPVGSSVPHLSLSESSGGPSSSASCPQITQMDADRR